MVVSRECPLEWKRKSKLTTIQDGLGFRVWFLGHVHGLGHRYTKV